MTRAEHHVQLTSFGGVGTSFVQTFLKNEGLSLPTEPDCGIWKHMRSPPGTPGRPDILVPEDFRAIYLVGDPVAAVLSVFRRGWQVGHRERVEATDGDWPTADWYLDDYLARGEDLYRLEEHFDHWTGCPSEGRAYPILILKSDAVWETLSSLLNFVELGQDRAAHFPLRHERQTGRFPIVLPECKGRMARVPGLLRRLGLAPSLVGRIPGVRNKFTVVENESDARVQALRDQFGSLIKKIDALPACSII